MRIFFLAVLIFAAISLSAQTYVSPRFTDYAQRATFNNPNRFYNDSNLNNKKWFFSKYSGISTSFVFYKGGNAMVVSAPISLQLNRRLNNNLYAFANIAAAPAYVNFTNSFLSANINKNNLNNSFIKSNNLGLYSSAAVGLMYVNDAKTFSISGSISIEKSSYPAFQYNQPYTKPAQQPVQY